MIASDHKAPCILSACSQFPAGRLTILILLVLLACPKPAQATDPGFILEMQEIEASLKQAPQSVILHRRRQELLLEAPDYPRHRLRADYARRLQFEGKTPENRYLLIRLADKSARLSAFKEWTVEQPDSPWGYFGLGEAHTDIGNFPAAKDAFRRAIELSPNIPDFHIQLAYALSSDNDLAGALSVLEKALMRSPGNPDLSGYRIWYLALSGHAESALREGTPLLAAFPNNRPLLYAVAEAHYQANHHAEAAQMLEQILMLWPRDRISWLKLCQVHMTLSSQMNAGRPTGADVNRACRKAHELNPEDWISLYYLSLAATNAPRESLVHSLYYAQKALALSPQENIAAQLEQNAASAMDRLTGDNNFVELLRPDDYVKSLSDLSLIDRRGLSNLQDDTAWAFLEETMKNPTWPGLSQLTKQFPDFAPAYYNRALFAENNCCDHDPMEDLQYAVTLAPGWPRSLSALAAEMISRKMFTPARYVLDLAEKLDPDDPVIRFNAELMSLYKVAVIDETAREMKHLLNQVRQDGSADFLDAGLVPYSNRLKRDPSSPRLHELYGDLYAASQRPEDHREAIRAYRQAIALGGDRARLDAKTTALNLEKP